MHQNFINMVIPVWRLMLDKDGKSKIWAMSRYMWPSFLKHLIGIKSFILISVHNFHQIFHLKTYKSTFYIYMISTGRENHFGLEFQCIALENFPIWFVSSNLAICWKVWLKISEKNWIKVDANAVLRLTEDPKTIVWKASPQKHSKHAHLHQLIFIYSWICREKYCYQKKNQRVQSPGFPIPNCTFKQGSWNFPQQCSWWCWYLYWRRCFQVLSSWPGQQGDFLVD